MKTEDMADLERQQELLIICLLSEPTKADAAKAAGVSRPTLYRWFSDARFMAAYRAARRQAFDEAIVILEKGSVRAAQVLVEELGENARGCSVRIAAATRIIDLAFRALATIEIDEELASLREIVSELRAGAMAKTPAPVAKVVPPIVPAGL